jgi:hypothetical protein
MVMESDSIKPGNLVTYVNGLTDEVYEVLCFMENSIALCQRKDGGRLRLNRNSLIHATEKQKTYYYNIK